MPSFHLVARWRWFVFHALILIALFVLAFVSGVNKVFSRDFFSIIQTYMYVQRHSLGESDGNDIATAAIKAMVKSGPNAKFAEVLDAETVTEFNRMARTGEAAGVGLYLRPIELGASQFFYVIGVVEGSPAQRAGMIVGDILTRVNDKSVLIDQSPGLRGRIGTQVKLSIVRQGINLNIAVERDLVKSSNVTFKRIKDRNGGYYINIRSFLEEDAAKDLKNVLVAHKPKKLILDLRDNPGGFIEQAVEAADLFVKEGKLLSLENRKGQVLKTYSAQAGSYDYEGDIVILVNKYTSSAAEILVAALKGRRGVTVVGDVTYGKGVSNTQVDLANGSRLVIPTAIWHDPSGRQISFDGIEPDIRVQDTRFSIPSFTLIPKASSASGRIDISAYDTYDQTPEYLVVASKIYNAVRQEDRILAKGEQILE